MATMREKAVEIATCHARAHDGEYAYLNVRENPDWRPHSWVVDAIEEALATADRSGPTRAECVTKFDRFDTSIVAALDRVNRLRNEFAATFGEVKAAEVEVEVVQSSGWVVLAGAALEDIRKGEQVQLQPSTGNVSAFFAEGKARPLMRENIAVRDAPAVRALLEWILQVELVEREGGNVNDLCAARSALIAELIKRGNVLMPHDSDVVAANLARVMIHDIERGQVRGTIKGSRAARSGMAQPPERLSVRSFESRLEELAEESYWTFDSHRAGRSRGELEGSPMAERDAFKGQVRRVARALQRIEDAAGPPPRETEEVHAAEVVVVLHGGARIRIVGGS